jgi:hypothetical protein
MTVRDDNTVDASRVVSLECYKRWMETRARAPPSPDAVFQRTVSGHLTAADGRGESIYICTKQPLSYTQRAAPFTPEEEKAILEIVREKRIWTCFEESSGRGRLGYRELMSECVGIPINTMQQAPGGFTRRTPRFPRQMSPERKPLFPTKPVCSWGRWRTRTWM